MVLADVIGFIKLLKDVIRSGSPEHLICSAGQFCVLYQKLTKEWKDLKALDAEDEEDLIMKEKEGIEENSLPLYDAQESRNYQEQSQTRWLTHARVLEIPAHL